MKEIIHLGLRTEYSFQKTFGHIKNVIACCRDVVGIADIGNTFSHFYLNEICKQENKKPIFGVKLMVVKNPELRNGRPGSFGPVYTFIAKNNEGLVEIHKLVSRSIECMYFRRHIGLIDVWKLSDNVIVIAPHFEVEERIDYIGLSFSTSIAALESDIPKVALVDNQIINAEDKQVYQLFVGSRKREGFTYPTHILSTEEWMVNFKNEDAINNTHVIADLCSVKFPIGEPVNYKGDKKIRTLCRQGAKKLNVNLRDPIYKERFNREMELIKDKDFVDYFLIVHEMVEKAKKDMLVGPGRGSSGGSLVCFLLGITALDPIRWDLLFDRFIDVNRHDAPDIDIDFPDTKRQSVIQELINTNTPKNVKNIATISRMRPRGAIGAFAKELKIPQEEIENIKNSIIEVSSGDVRYGDAMGHTFTNTELGKNFIKKYPNMEMVSRIENHARHSGKHAAGVIVATKPLIDFASIDPNDNTIQMEGYSAEKISLLKIDCLGLSTLSVLEEIADLAGFNYRILYDLDFKCDKTFKLFRERRLKGIFQYDGPALAGLCRGILVREIEDIIAITALARPGPLHSGGAGKFARIHSGKEEIEFLMQNKDVIEITKKTMGVVVYQEQVMKIMRQVGGFPWYRVSSMRRVIAKKGGKEAIDEYKDQFIAGATEKKIKLEDAESAWSKILEFAQYGFNRSHAVAYGMVSYWTAWCKAHYPMEFLVANLNSGGDTANKKRLIREMKNHHEFEIVPFDYELSSEKWKYIDGKLIGGLTNIGGIGIKNATVIMRKRITGESHAKGIAEKLKNPTTNFDIIYPCAHYWGEMFSIPKRYGLYESPTVIESMNKKGEYLLIAKLMKKNVRDLNETQNVVKRGGEILEDRTKLLNLVVEDDTGAIMCRVGRDDYEKLGAIIAEEGEEEKDWYLMKGKIISDEIIFLFISEIYKLGDGYSLGETERDLRN